MANRPSLAAKMREVGQPPARLVPVMAPAPEVAEKPKAATREGMKRVTAILSPEDHRRLKRLSLDSDKKLETLLIEAVNDLLAKHNA